MKTIFFFALLLTFSCAHHHTESEHHHHDDKTTCGKCSKQVEVAFDKKCAHAILEGDDHIEGNEEFTLIHGGRKYYFSSKEKMEQFQAHLSQNVKKASNRWEAMRR